MNIIDCHAHVFSERSLPFEEQKSHWQKAGVTRVVHVFCLESDLEIAQEQLALETTDPDLVFVAGVTPHGADKYTEDIADFLRQHQNHFVAIGETGLDFHYTISPRETQIEVFHRHLELALEFDKPVVLHLRDADEEAKDILSQYKDKLAGVMLHCYTSGLELAKWGVENGMYVSASGILTFKKSQDLREIFQQVPLSQLLVETDSPYLAPHPFRGKTNQPGLVVETYKYLAEMYGVSFEQLCQTVWENSSRLFRFESS